MAAATESPELRVLIVADSVSLRFGGEAALPLHYFRILRSRGIPAWLIAHSRTREELETVFASDRERLHFIADTRLHRTLWRLSRLLPERVAGVTSGFLLYCATQLAQRSRIRRLVREHGISVIHQPTPVSPKLPSLIHGVGAPVVIGPMNGGMHYPPAFRAQEGIADRLTLIVGRSLARLSNQLLPGKRRAALLLVANERTRAALPAGLSAPVVSLVENGVDLTLWQRAEREDAPYRHLTRFACAGRLVDLKAVDLLLEAFRRASAEAPMSLAIIGDGPSREQLQQLAQRLGVAERCSFLGWMSQSECAAQLQDSDVLVLSSLRECGGAVVLEAMAAQLAVIATAWGGPLDYLDPSCGILVAPTSRERFISGLADAMVYLARNPEQRVAMGRAGRLKAQQQFDWQAKIDRILQLYRSVIERSPPIHTP